MFDITDSISSVAQLIVRNIEDEIVDRLKRRAAAAGVSAEEEHRRILRRALQENRDFVEHLLSVPQAAEDDDEDLFVRQPGTGIREIDW